MVCPGLLPAQQEVGRSILNSHRRRLGQQLLEGLLIAQLLDHRKLLLIAVIGLIIHQSRKGTEMLQHTVIHVVDHRILQGQGIKKLIVGPKDLEAAFEAVFMKPVDEALTCLMLHIIQVCSLDHRHGTAVAQIAEAEIDILVDLQFLIVVDGFLPDQLQTVELVAVGAHQMPVIQLRKHGVDHGLLIRDQLRLRPEDLPVAIRVYLPEAADHKLALAPDRRLMKALQHNVIHIVVSVQGHKPLAGGLPDPIVPGCRHAAVFLVDHQQVLMFPCKLIQDLPGLIRGSVVHCHHFHVPVGLGQG